MYCMWVRMYVHDYATRLYTHAVYSRSTQSTACTVVVSVLFHSMGCVCVCEGGGCVGGGGGGGVRGGGEGEGGVAEGQLHRRYPEMPNVTELNRRLIHIWMSLSDAWHCVDSR